MFTGVTDTTDRSVCCRVNNTFKQWQTLTCAIMENYQLFCEMHVILTFSYLNKFIKHIRTGNNKEITFIYMHISILSHNIYSIRKLTVGAGFHVSLC